MIKLVGNNLSIDINPGQYSDKTPWVKIPDFVDIAGKIHTYVVQPQSLYEFVTAMFLCDSFGYNKKLILPYVPGARQDRMNYDGDILRTASCISRMINERFFSKVVVLDPHSKVLHASIDNMIDFPLPKVFADFNSDYDAVIAPDKGAIFRANNIAKQLGLSVVFGSKVRDTSTGALTGFDVKVIPGNKYLVVDDICDGGGTFIGLGQKIIEQAAKADLYVSHGIFSKGTKDLLALFGQIFTTDSFISDKNGCTIIPVVDQMIIY